MNRFIPKILAIFLFSVSAFSQTKPLTDAQAEIKTFSNPENFSVVYDSAKYVTKAEVSFDILERKTPLSKIFKKFGFKITSLFAIDGIDTKPVRSTLCINTQSKRFHFSSNRNLTLTINSEVINLGEANRSTKVKGRKIKEDLCWEIDQEILEDTEKAERIGYEVGRIKGSIDKLKLRFFKDFAKLLKITNKQKKTPNK